MRLLYGTVLKIPKFAKKEIEDIVNPYLEFYPQCDRALIKERAVRCIIQRHKLI